MSLEKDTVVICNGALLLLTRVERDANGDVIGGTVINGEWKLKIELGLVKALDYFGHVVTEGKLNSLVEIPIPNGVSGDYNEIIEKTYGQYLLNKVLKS